MGEFISKAEAEAKFQSKDEAKEDRHELKTLMTKLQLEVSEISKHNAVQTEQIKTLARDFIDHMDNEEADRKTLLGILNELRDDSKKKIDKADFKWIIGGIVAGTIAGFSIAFSLGYTHLSEISKQISSIEEALIRYDPKIIKP